MVPTLVLAFRTMVTVTVVDIVTSLALVVVVVVVSDATRDVR
jgi:hypothetical protein